MMFPGQGAQYTGMILEELLLNKNSKLLLKEASETLGLDVVDMCNNPEKKHLLDSTAFSQPCIFAASMARIAAYMSDDIGTHPLSVNKPTIALGLSLGEYSALCYAGVFSFADGMMLTSARGQAMQRACDIRPGKMTAVVGMPWSRLEALCTSVETQTGQIARIGNYLSPGSSVLAGGCSQMRCGV